MTLLFGFGPFRVSPCPDFDAPYTMFDKYSKNFARRQTFIGGREIKGIEN
jgi:hypothetical protein